MSAGDKLPPKRKRFAEAYVGSAKFNGAEAYRQAGYKCGGPSVARTEATRVLADPSVENLIDELIADSGIADKIDRKTVITGIYRLLQRAIKADDLNAQARALEMLGRANRAFSDHVTVETVGSADLLMSLRGAISDDALAELATDLGVDTKDLGISTH